MGEKMNKKLLKKIKKMKLNTILPLALIFIGSSIVVGSLLGFSMFQTFSIVDSKWEGGKFYYYGCSEGTPTPTCEWRVYTVDFSSNPIDFYTVTPVMQLNLDLWNEPTILKRLQDMKICGDAAQPVWWNVNQSGVVIGRTHPDDYEPWAILNVGCSYYVRPSTPAPTQTPPPETETNIAVPSYVSGGSYTQAQEVVGINATSPAVIVSNVTAGQPIVTPSSIIPEEKAPAVKVVEVVKEVEKKVEVTTGISKRMLGGILMLIGGVWLYVGKK